MCSVECRTLTRTPYRDRWIVGFVKAWQFDDPLFGYALEESDVGSREPSRLFLFLAQCEDSLGVVLEPSTRGY
jgi:hypothetical protein